MVHEPRLARSAHPTQQSHSGPHWRSGSGTSGVAHCKSSAGRMPDPSSIKHPMQKPLGIGQAAEQPKANSRGRFDPVVIPLHVAAAPPAGLNSFRPPDAGHAMAAVQMKLNRRPFGHHRQHLQRDRLVFQPQRPRQEFPASGGLSFRFGAVAGRFTRCLIFGRDFRQLPANGSYRNANSGWASGCGTARTTASRPKRLLSRSTS